VKADAYGHTNGSAATLGKSLLLFSANSAGAMTAVAKSHHEYYTQHPALQAAMAYTLAYRRERLKLGSYCIAGPSGFSELTTPVPFQSAQRVAFVFTGQGAQWVRMGKELMQEQPIFADSIRSMDAVLRSLKVQRPTWTLEGPFPTPKPCWLLADAKQKLS
jgi:acyl transferase domain-containing protein